MIKLDDNLLNELGLGNLPKEEKAEFLKHMYQTLELNVGTQLANRMSDAQMSEFEQYINGNDEQGAFHWLEANFPDYKNVVAAEFEKLKTEIRPVAEHIVAASAAQSHGHEAAPAVHDGQPLPPQPSAHDPYQPQMAPQQPPAYQQPAQPMQPSYDQPPQQPQPDRLAYGPQSPPPAYPQQSQPQYGQSPQAPPPQPPTPQY